MPVTQRVPWSSRTSKMMKNYLEKNENAETLATVQNGLIVEAKISRDESKTTPRCVIPSLSFLCNQVLQLSQSVPRRVVVHNITVDIREESVKNIQEKVLQNSDEEASESIVNDGSKDLVQKARKEEQKRPQGTLHVTADYGEELHRTPEREFVDFESDDAVADPDYSGESECDNDQNEKEKNLARKRKADPTQWKKNLTKRKRNLVLEYETDSGSRVMNPKILKEPCGDNCKLSCKKRISEERRQIIHSNCWSPSKTVDQRRQYIASIVTQVPIKRRREKTGKRRGKRMFTYCYSFETEGKKETVCKKFFLNTLSISQQTVDTAVKKKKEGGIVTPDKRGRHQAVNKIFEESHYSRERTKKKYLGNHLNISRMYRLYLEECQENGFESENIAKEWLYAEIFNYEYNYSFKSPDNDTCDLCYQL
nr:unnamed protein product [Callosobruchus analis]